MKYSTFTRAIALLFLAAAPAALSQTPALVSYQGRVQTGTPPVDFSGTGQFKFALIAGTANISVAATATATRTGGFITDYTVVNQGAGYITAPVVTVTGGGGSGATATAVLTGDKVTALTPADGGTGYTGTPTVTIAAPPSRQESLWNNNGATTADPVNAVSLPVTGGLYSVLLGDVSLPNMDAIPLPAFARPDVRLRVWFNGQQLSPDQRLAPNGYLPGNIFVSGNVGIGTSTPSGLLEIRNNSEANENLRLSGSAYAAAGGTSTQGISMFLGVNRDDLQRADLMFAYSGKLAASDSVVRIIPGQGTAAYVDCTTRDGGAFKDLGLNYTAMTIKANGSVGIGTTTPTQAKLVISGNNSYTLAGNSGYLRQTLVATEVSNPTVANGTVQVPVQVVSPQLVLASVYASNDMLASGFRAFSDERIKRVTGRSDGAHDLALLKGIEVTDYTHIDTVGGSTGRQKKVIAQQVEKVYPQAVSRSTDVVPDIYRKAAAKDGWVQLATNLKPGERVRLIGEKQEGIHDVLEIREGAFRTAFMPEGDKVFVFGREVNDFRSVDYEAISMLNVSATQELARQLGEKDREIAALKADIAALQAKDESRDAQLATLMKFMEGKRGRAEEAAVSTVSLVK